MSNREHVEEVIKDNIDELPSTQDMTVYDWANFIIRLITEHPFLFAGLCLGACIGNMLDIVYKDHKENKKNKINTDLKVIKGGK